MDKSGTPSLLPILRSQQQGVILALLLGNEQLELSLTEIAEHTGAPYPSVHREIERGEAAGVLCSRKIGKTRLARANTDSPYFVGLSDLLVKAFGPRAILGEALAFVEGVDRAYLYGSWAARFSGDQGKRPVGDLDLLVLGIPDREALYTRVGAVEGRLGREVQVTIRETNWLEQGCGAFHTNVVESPLVELMIVSPGRSKGNPPQ